MKQWSLCSMQLGHTSDPRDADELRRTLPTSPTLMNKHKNTGGFSKQPPPFLVLVSFSCSVLLSRHPGYVNRNHQLVAYNPSVVPRRDNVGFTGAELLLRAVVEPDVQSARYVVAGVQHLAAVSSCYGLNVSDHLQPGSNTSREAVKSPSFTTSALPFSKVLVSSGWSRLLR